MRAWVAIALGGLYFVLGFVVPLAFHLRRTGESPLKLKPTGTADRVSKALQVVALAAARATPLSHLLVLPLLVEWDWMLQVGAALMAVGIVLTVWAQQVMGKSWRIGVDPGERTPLVVHSPFRWVRNPVYTGLLTTALGLVFVVPNVFAVVTFLAAVGGLQILVRAVEEPYLVGVHGEDYLAYARCTGRFVPAVGRGVYRTGPRHRRRRPPR